MRWPLKTANDSPSAATPGDFRKKVDALAQHESGGLFLKDREVGDYEASLLVNPKAVEARVIKLTHSTDQETAK